MTRLMYDSVTATDIPVGVPIVAGYVNGPFAWSHNDWQYHIGSIQVGIAISADYNGGHVLDVEAGDALPSQAPAWVAARLAAGVQPTIYIQASRVQEVIDAFTAAGQPGLQIWIAAWNGQADVPPGTYAHQYANSVMAGGHYDLSAVADFWPGVDGQQPSTPTPDPGYSFGPVPPGNNTWAFKKPGTPNPPQLGAPPGGNFTWEWIALSVPGDVNSYPGGPTYRPPGIPAPDPGWSFGPPPGGNMTWAWKVPGTPGPGQFGPPPPGGWTWEWIALSVPGDVNSYLGGPTYSPTGTPVINPASLDGLRASWATLAGSLNAIPAASAAVEAELAKIRAV